jgi:hypothetical protein
MYASFYFDACRPALRNLWAVLHILVSKLKDQELSCQGVKFCRTFRSVLGYSVVEQRCEELHVLRAHHETTVIGGRLKFHKRYHYLTF